MGNAQRFLSAWAETVDLNDAQLAFLASWFAGLAVF